MIFVCFCTCLGMLLTNDKLYFRKKCFWLFVHSAPLKATTFKQLKAFELSIVPVLQNVIASILAASDQSGYFFVR